MSAGLALLSCVSGMLGLGLAFAAITTIVVMTAHKIWTLLR